MFSFCTGPCNSVPRPVSGPRKPNSGFDGCRTPEGGLHSGRWLALRASLNLLGVGCWLYNHIRLRKSTIGDLLFGPCGQMLYSLLLRKRDSFCLNQHRMLPALQSTFLCCLHPLVTGMLLWVIWLLSLPIVLWAVGTWYPL